MISHLKYSLKYLKYYLFSKHKKGHSIHSPFMFKLIIKVFNNDTINNDLQKVIEKHKELRKSKDTIEYDEIGAGSKYKKHKKEELGKIIKRSSISKKYGKLLFNLIQYFESKDILELGTSVGISTSYMAMASKELNIKSIEGVTSKTEIAKDLANQLNQNTEFIIGDFDDSLSEVLKNYDKLDFVFFDGNHKKVSTLSYFYKCLQKTHNNSVFVFDDIHWSTEMESAWNEIINNKAVKVSVDLFRMGIIFFKQELSYEKYVVKY